jgi:hypothetical protein
MANFKKMAELEPDQRSEFVAYMEQLFGSEYASDMAKDYKPEKLENEKASD